MAHGGYNVSRNANSYYENSKIYFEQLDEAFDRRAKPGRESKSTFRLYVLHILRTSLTGAIQGQKLHPYLIKRIQNM